MSSADGVVGMMDGAYFIPRTEILDFFNTLLGMSLTKVEQTASGAVACQVMDYLYPGSIPMKRVNWEAKSDFQFIENYKILQAALTKKGIQKNVDVDRLIRAKCQDNLEFCQWLKAFFEQVNTEVREDYDPIYRRSLGKGGKRLDDVFLPKKKWGGGTSSSAGTAGSRSTATTTMASNRRKVTSSKSSATSSTIRSKKSTPSPSSKHSNRTQQRNRNHSTTPERQSRSSKQRSPNLPHSSHTNGDHTSATKAIPSSPKTNPIDAELKTENLKLKKKVAEIELSMNGYEQERDFYFEKLRGIEVLLQVHEEKGQESNSNDVIQNIFRVLYARHEDGVQVTDDGEILDTSLAISASENLLNDTMDQSFDDL